MFDWLSDPDVMKVLGFYGGGCATIISGLWIAYTKFFSRKSGKAATPTANSNNVVSAGNDMMIDGDVTITQTPRAAWVVLGIGVVALALTAIFSGKTTNVECGLLNPGEISNSQITVTGSDCDGTD